MRRVVNRLRRAEGQLHALIASIGPEASCRDVDGMDVDEIEKVLLSLA